MAKRASGYVYNLSLRIIVKGVRVRWSIFCYLMTYMKWISTLEKTQYSDIINSKPTFKKFLHSIDYLVYRYTY